MTCVTTWFGNGSSEGFYVKLFFSHLDRENRGKVNKVLHCFYTTLWCFIMFLLDDSIQFL